MIKSPETWAKLNVHMNNPDIEHGSFKERIFSKIFLRKEEEEYLKTMMMTRAAMGQEVQEIAKQYTNKKFPWQSMVANAEEEEAQEILEKEAGKTYEVIKTPIKKE